MTPPPSRPEARSRLGCQSAHELGAPVASSMPEQLPVKSRGQTYHIVGEPKPRCATQQNRVVGVRFGSLARITAAQHWRPVHLNQQTLEVGRQSCTCRLALTEDLRQQRALGHTLKLSPTASLA